MSVNLYYLITLFIRLAYDFLAPQAEGRNMEIYLLKKDISSISE